MSYHKLYRDLPAGSAVIAVRDWMKTAGQTVNEEPTAPSKADALLRSKLILEETIEFVQAILSDSVRIGDKDAYDILKALDAAHDQLVAYAQKPECLPGQIDMKASIDAMADIEVVNIGTFVTFGMNYNDAFKRVMESNFSKFEDGVAIKDELGKIQKGKDYFKPDFSGLYGESEHQHFSTRRLRYEERHDGPK